MSIKLKITAFMGAILIALYAFSPADARERGNHPSGPVIYGGNPQIIYTGPAYQQRYYGPPGQYKKFKKAKWRKKMRKMRRLRRLHNAYHFDRPVIIITRPIFR